MLTGLEIRPHLWYEYRYLYFTLGLRPDKAIKSGQLRSNGVGPIHKRLYLGEWILAYLGCDAETIARITSAYREAREPDSISMEVAV